MIDDKLKTHWVADIFWLNQSDVDAIADNIRENGQELPIHVLEDGRIVDGRNRWLACQQAGVEPKTITIPNVNGKPPSDEELLGLAVRLNGKRRQTTKVQSACAAALAWKEMYPDGAPTGRPKQGKKLPSFNDFVQTMFGVNREYAKQALAVLNWDKERFAMVMAGEYELAKAHAAYREHKAQIEEARRNAELLQKHEDLKEAVGNGAITGDDAVAAAKNRDAEEVARQEAEALEWWRDEIAQKEVNRQLGAARKQGTDLIQKIGAQSTFPFLFEIGSEIITVNHHSIGIAYCSHLMLKEHRNEVRAACRERRLALDMRERDTDRGIDILQALLPRKNSVIGDLINEDGKIEITQA